MDRAEDNGERQRPEPLDRGRLVVSSALTLACLVLCLFPPAGTWSWLRGWLFLAVLITSFVLIAAYLWRVNPDIYAARSNRHEGTKPWDRWVLLLLIPLMVSTMPL